MYAYVSCVYAQENHRTFCVDIKFWARRQLALGMVVKYYIHDCQPYTDALLLSMIYHAHV